MTPVTKFGDYARGPYESTSPMYLWIMSPT